MVSGGWLRRHHQPRRAAQPWAAPGGGRHRRGAAGQEAFPPARGGPEAHRRARAGPAAPRGGGHDVPGHGSGPGHHPAAPGGHRRAGAHDLQEPPGRHPGPGGPPLHRGQGGGGAGGGRVPQRAGRHPVQGAIDRDPERPERDVLAPAGREGRDPGPPVRGQPECARHLQRRGPPVPGGLQRARRPRHQEQPLRRADSAGGAGPLQLRALLRAQRRGGDRAARTATSGSAASAGRSRFSSATSAASPRSRSPWDPTRWPSS